MRLFAEEEVFKQENYGDEAIEKRSSFYQQQVSENNNMWIGGFYTQNILEDETDYFQVGQYHVNDFHTFEII